MHLQGERVVSSENTTDWIFTNWEFLFHAELVLFGFSQSFNFLHLDTLLLHLLTDLYTKIQSDPGIFNNLGISRPFFSYLWVFNTWFISCMCTLLCLKNRCFLGNNHILGILILTHPMIGKTRFNDPWSCFCHSANVHQHPPISQQELFKWGTLGSSFRQAPWTNPRGAIA